MMTKEVRATLYSMGLFAGFFLVFTGPAEAITAPTAGSFAYDIYDVAVNSILKGPIGFVAGLSAIVLGSISAIKGQMMLAFPAILGGAGLIKADTIVNSMGAIF